MSADIGEPESLNRLFAGHILFCIVQRDISIRPGGQILRSFELIHWEHAANVFDLLDSTEGQTLTGDTHIYGKGMWAASLRIVRLFTESDRRAGRILRLQIHYEPE